ncbi:MAG: helix-turn-helix transcriptional regulator [Deltaproteobacteria bacterium]|nr:MAG: helix-turn-helix transcriptional regulator [Deltaproteobacteria bacterium]
MGRKVLEISASVCVDGGELKRIREEKRLTQLYVSKVVGVTTDTISRWENNRYPSMRRENALKLAEALEVPVEELLRKPAPPVEAAPAPPRRLVPWLIGSVVAVVALVGVLLAVFARTVRQPPPPASITAERVLPNFAAPGSAIPVQVRLTQRSDEGGYILREYLPKGWKLVQSNPPASSLDNDNGMVRWIVKAGDSRERIAYLVEVDRTARSGSTGNFQGEVVAGSGDSRAAVPVQGAAQVAVAPVAWADLNGDGRIDDGEMLQASHTVDEMSGVHIDWLELERLWNAGGYRWDDGRGRFVPVKPLESPGAAPRR